MAYYGQKVGTLDRGSVAMLGMHGGVEHMVRDEDALRRGEVSGYNVQDLGQCRLLHPRISRKHFEILQDTKLPGAEGEFEDLLASCSAVSSAAKAKFRSTRKAVWKPMPNGCSRLVLVPRAPIATDEVDLLEGLPVDEAMRRLDVDVVDRAVLRERPVKRTYQLMSVFNDSSVLDKYPVSNRQVMTAKRLAASEPSAGARMIQEAMNSSQNDIEVRVTSRQLQNSESQACSTVREFCRGYSPPQHVIDSAIVGSMIYMYGGEGADKWMVKGPVKYASETYSLYCLVAVEGTVLPYLLLEMECVVLDIDVGTPYDVSMPQIEFHSGSDEVEPLQSGVSEETAVMLSADARFTLDSMAGALSPVLSRDGRPMATAVRVSDRHVLVNTHVADADPGCTVAGEVLRPMMQLSRDVWAAQCLGNSRPWILREPVKGEAVVLCSATQDGYTCSAPLRITSVQETTLVLSVDHRIGLGSSGAAVVALSDLSLLGVHSAGTNLGLLAYRFGPAQFADLLSSDAVSSVSRTSDVEEFGGQVLEYFRKKGLSHLLMQTVGCMVELRCGGMPAGMGVRMGGRLYTTCDKELALTLPGNDKPLVLRGTDDSPFVHVADGYTAGSGGPAFCREPNVFEKCFFLGWDGEPYVSTEMRVSYVGFNASNFVVTGEIPDKPWTGALVVAWDGAVLGIVAHMSGSTPVGLGWRCWPLPKPKPAKVADPREIVRSQFPFLNVEAWPDNLVEEVFTHSSAGRYADDRPFNNGCKPLANVGDSAAKAYLYQVLRSSDVPHATWADYARNLQSNAHFTELAWKFKIAQCIVLGPGCVLPETSKSYADMLEALVGAVYIVESREVFELFCSSMGLVPDLADRTPRSSAIFSSLPIRLKSSTPGGSSLRSAIFAPPGGEPVEPDFEQPELD